MRPSNTNDYLSVVSITHVKNMLFFFTSAHVYSYEKKHIVDKIRTWSYLFLGNRMVVSRSSMCIMRPRTVGNEYEYFLKSCAEQKFSKSAANLH